MRLIIHGNTLHARNANVTLTKMHHLMYVLMLQVGKETLSRGTLRDCIEAVVVAEQTPQQHIPPNRRQL